MKKSLERHKKVERTVLSMVVLGPVLFVCFLVFVQWPRWWVWVVPEQSPLGWMQSLLLFAIGGVILSLTCRAYIKEGYGKPFVDWGVLALGFFYLMADERFALHERVRDRILAPQGISLPGFFWIAPGDFVLLVLLVAGVLWSKRVWKRFVSPAGKKLFAVALLLSTLSVLTDSVNWHGTALGAQRLEQFWEEIVETSAMILFLVGFLKEAFSQS